MRLLAGREAFRHPATVAFTLGRIAAFHMQTDVEKYGFTLHGLLSKLRTWLLLLAKGKCVCMCDEQKTKLKAMFPFGFLHTLTDGLCEVLF